MTAPVILPDSLPQDRVGDAVRRLAAGINGGLNGPQLVIASMVVPSYGNLTDGSAWCDGYYAVDATAGAVTIQAPPAVSTPLGTTIAVSKIDASGNGAIFSTASPGDATPLSNGATSKNNTTRGTTNSYVLMNVGNLTVPSFVWNID